MAYITAGEFLPYLASILAVLLALDVGSRRRWPHLTTGAVASAAAVPLSFIADRMIHS